MNKFWVCYVWTKWICLTLWVNIGELNACILQEVQGQGDIMKLEFFEKTTKKFQMR